MFLDELTFDGEQFGALFAHQRAGVAWLWQRHVARAGGVLGDDMGMGIFFVFNFFLYSSI